MGSPSLHDLIAHTLASPISRRALLARSIALGLSTSTAGTLLAACGAGTPSGPAGTPRPSPEAPSQLPEIIPAPREATYGPLRELGALACYTCPAGNLSDRVAETLSTAGVALLRQAECPASGSTLRVLLDASDLPPQGYRLGVAPADGGIEILLEAADEPGAFFGLQSLAQLVVTRGSMTSVRQATIVDAPGFPRRGAILDPPWLEVLRFGVPYKLNLVAVANWSAQAWSELPGMIDYCRSHYVEVMSMVGFANTLTDTPIADLKAMLASQFKAGVRSFCLKWDDIQVDDPVAMAQTHGRIFNQLCDFLHTLDPETQTSVVLPPYGGIPPQVFGAEAGMTYLALMKDQLPADVVVFWTGDGGVFSEAVTTVGAKAYGSAVGHPVGLWDNNALWFADWYRPLSGRDRDLATVVSTYMGNMNANEMTWEGSGGYFALLTELQYAWRPESYDAGVACTTAERLLHASGRWTAPGSTCAPPGASWTPEVIPTARPLSSLARSHTRA
jgi:hypothetical protein